MGGLTNDDPLVAVAGALTRTCPMQAKRNTPVLAPGLAHRAGLGRAPPVQGKGPTPRGQVGQRPQQAGNVPRQGRPDSPIELTASDPPRLEWEESSSLGSVRLQRRAVAGGPDWASTRGPDGSGCVASPTTVPL